MKRSINIVIGNHAGYRGIQDYTHYLEFTFSRLGYVVSESILPRQDVAANIWIEEFSAGHDPVIGSRHNDAPLEFVVCSEFPSRLGTFNVFDLRDRIIALIRYLFPVRFIVRNIFYRNRFLDLPTILSLPLLLLGYLMGMPSKDTLYRLQLAARFISLKKISRQVAGFIVINDRLRNLYKKQFPSVPVYVLTPLLPDVSLTATHTTFSFCIFSGQSQTKFRRRWIHKVIFAQTKVLPINILGRYALRQDKSGLSADFAKLRTGISNSGTGCVFLGKFSPEEDLPKGNNSNDRKKQYIICEVYVGQTRSWPFASPMRDYHAFRNGHISINAGHYIAGIFGDLVIVAPKEPHNFIKFIQKLNIEQFIKALPDHIASHNTRYLPLNQAEVETLLPEHPSTQDETKVG
jgi:hypothetical protein